MTDDQGSPVAAAVVRVEGIAHNVTTTAGGEFWRLLTPGTYTLAVSALGHEDSAAQTVVVTNAGEAAVQAGEEQEVERGEGGQEHQGGHSVQQAE